MKLELGKNFSKEVEGILQNCYYVAKEHNNSVLDLQTLVRGMFRSLSRNILDFFTENSIILLPLLEDIESEERIQEFRNYDKEIISDSSLWDKDDVRLTISVTSILRTSSFEADILGQKEITVEALFMGCIKSCKVIYDLFIKHEITYDIFVKYFQPKFEKRSLVWENEMSKEELENKLEAAQGGLFSALSDLLKLSSPFGAIPGNDNPMPDNNSGEKLFNNFKNQFGGFGMNEDEELDRALKENGNSKTPYLDTYCKYMNEEAKKGEYDPVLGREKELEELIEILCCRKKNNAAIIGENGAGKSSLVEKLAMKLAENDVPTALRGKKLYMLDTIALIGGTKFRGEFEARLQGIIKEVLADPDIILNVPELHTLSGLGSSSGGSGDATNFLKPYLTNKNFRLIGTTTFEEYKKFIMSDKALMRRFQTVVIKVPGRDETIDILNHLKTKYEEHHKVIYTPEAIKACVDYTDRYIMDRNQPDKAFDILDMSGSKVKLGLNNNQDFIKTLETELETLKQGKKDSIEVQDFEKAAEYRDREVQVQKSLDKELGKGKGDPRSKWPKVTEDDVANVVGKITGVKVEKITSDEMDKLRELKNAMTTQIIGQDEAIDEIVVNLQKSRLGLRDPKKPIFCGFLAGKTGVGKSLTAKLIAKEFFGSEDAHINISMSQFTNASDASKLLGAAAGYVGYEDSSIFDQVRNKPYSLVTFEEAEKADPAIFQQLLKVLDEGIIEMSDGSEISFRNCIILFTSNLGTKELMAGKIGFDDKNKENTIARDNSIVMGAIKKFFRPEFINRLDSIIVYNALGKEELTKIVDLELKDPVDRVLKAGYKVKLPKGIQEFIVSKGREEYGAREIKRNISTLILDPICKLILEPENMGKKKINVKIDKEKDELTFEVM